MRPGEDSKPLVLVEKPHPHDVLCGRGGRTNLHKGNIWFRRLVRSNRALYKTCPKHTKLLVAKAVVKAVQGQDPPGRYLEADKATGGWKEIPYKRALDKTSQALRERDPNPTPENGGFSSRAKEAAASASKNANLEGLTKATLEQAGLLDDLRQSSSLKTEPITKPPPTKKRKEPEQFQKPAWWSQGTPIPTATQPSGNSSMAASGGVEPIMKRQKAEEDEAPLPLDALQSRQSSFFGFLSSTGIFGSKPAPPPPAPPAQSSLMYGNNSGMQMNNSNQRTFDHMNMGAASNNNNNFAFQQQQQLYYASGGGNDQAAMMQQPKMQATNSLVNVFEPFPIDGQDGGNFANNNRSNNMTLDQMQVREQMQMIQRNSIGSRRDSAASTNGLGFDGTQKMAGNYAQQTNNRPVNQEDVGAAPSRAGLTTQVSDWLTSFYPPAGEDDAPPPPPGQDLQRSISSTLFNIARSPSQFLTSLKSGVTSMFMDSANDAGSQPPPMSMPAPPPGALTQNQSFGTRSNSIKDSLLDDTEDNPFETKLRQFPSR